MSARTKTIGATKDRSELCRVLIVDDSAVARLVVRRIVERSSSFEVIGQAATGQDALKILDELSADLILLDIEMPGMSGIEAIPALLEKSDHAPILIVSSLCRENAEASVQAMTIGASDTVLKPPSGIVDGDFADTLETAMERLWRNRCQRNHRPAETLGAQAPERHVREPTRSSTALGCIAIGASTGGLHALAEFFEHLPIDLRVPILITQHLPPEFVGHFAEQMTAIADRPVTVAHEGAWLVEDSIFVTPGAAHLTLSGDKQAPQIKLLHPPDATATMASVDAMFESVARYYGVRGVAVVLSGMGRDGLRGAATMVERGGQILAQDQASAVVWGMPGSIAKQGIASRLAPPGELAEYVAGLYQEMRRG